jgi:2-polyprenyl-3-methyl-5-hydroxy-6-metoxy-1,4-benzoquinol methylase
MTLHYYQNHAQDFFDGTVNVDMTPLYEAFTQHLPHGARVLDAGCGSGRDAKAFHEMGYQVDALMPLPRWWSWHGNIPGYPCS